MLRHSPDLYNGKVSAFAGPAIGIRRTFFLGRASLVAFQKPIISTRDSVYKALYK
ncbi:MAG: hypothetical protein FD138_2850 [Planctomycetota bacterium]|nr:MAG: hypothetical protein FD138_2850 [Planctomycetota bacterium]